MINKYPSDAKFHEALLKAISTTAFDFVAAVREDSREIVYINEMGAKLFEYEKSADLLGMYSPSLRKNKLSKEEMQARDEAIASAGFFIQETEYITKTGKTFWGRLQLNPFSAGRTKYLLMQIEKVDRARLAEDVLQKEKLRFGMLFDYASIGVIIVNQRHEIVTVNPFALSLFNYTGEEIIGKRIETLIPLRFYERHLIHQHNFFNNPQSRPMGLGMDLFAIRKDGTEFPVEISLSSYSSPDEMFVFVTDITARKKNEEQIKQLSAGLERKVKERTEALDLTIAKLERQIRDTESAESELKKSLEREKELGVLKSRFVSMASHEFRTPLSTILSSAYLLEKYTETEDQPKRSKHIDRIISSVNALTDLLNDFLSIGKIEEGKIIPNHSQFNIKEHISNIINDIRSIKKKNQQFIYRHKGENIVCADASMLKNILVNLLSNAIKFSPEGSAINIDSYRNGSILQLHVKDAGIGISKEDQVHLFERYFGVTTRYPYRVPG